MSECDFMGQCTHTSFSMTHHSCLTALWRPPHPRPETRSFLSFRRETARLCQCSSGDCCFYIRLSCLCHTTPHQEEWFTAAVTSDEKMGDPPLSCIAFSGLGDMFSTHFSPEDHSASITGEGGEGFLVRQLSVRPSPL